jgi:hypothetical protein
MLLGLGAVHGGGSEPRRLTVHYISRKIAITSAYVEVADVRIAISDLQGVVCCLTYTYPTFKVSCITGCMEVVLAVPFATVYGSVLMLCAGFISGAGLALGALADARRNPRWLTIDADYRGRRITLLSTCDKREFGQVRRALIRALEDNRL